MTTKYPDMTAPATVNSSDKDQQIKMLDLYKEDQERFGKILRSMNLDRIPGFASEIRQKGHHSTGNNPSAALAGSCSIACKLTGPPLCGSFHIVFPIGFMDGVEWMLKISANGDHYDSVAAVALASEAQTMRMVKKRTTIPVPEVYAFDTSSNNSLSAPFILMERLGGKPLTRLWFNQETPKACLEHFRIKTLQSLAGIMVQLNKFTVSTSGSLVFDSDGNPVGLGSAKVVDAVAEFNKAKAYSVHRKDDDTGDKNTPDESRSRNCKSNAPSASVHSETGVETRDDDDIIYERGPFSDSKAYFMSNLDRSDPAFKADAYDRGTDMCLRLFIEWAFANRHTYDRRFVLTHPDLDVQNILVTDDGTITGLIDWDGVAAVPREIGCTQYPLWLMRDWVPLRYNYDTENGKVFADAGYQESSPAELASYRALYAQAIEVEIAKMTGGSNRPSTLGTLPEHEAKLTRRSLVMRNLDLSAGDPWAALGTINYIIDQIEELTAPEWEDDDSDTDSVSSCSSTSDSDSITSSDMDEEDEGVKLSKLNEKCLSGMTADVHTHDRSLEPGVMECVVSEKHSPCEEAEGNRVSLNPPGISKPSFEEPKTLKSLNKTSAGPGWMRRLLQSGCDTAEKSLRRIARIGYVIEDAVDQVAEKLADVGSHHVEIFVGGNSGQPVSSSISKQEGTTGSCEPSEMKHMNDISTSEKSMVRKQRTGAHSKEPNLELPEASSVQVNIDPEQTQKFSTIEPQQIPMRKAELLEKARMEKRAEWKAIYRADKAKIKKELKVWEHIALAVWVRGVSLEQLKNNQFRIARWVADTLQEDQGNTNYPPVGVDTRASAAGTQIADSCAVDDNFTQPREEPKKVSNKEAVRNTNEGKKHESSTGSWPASGAQTVPAEGMILYSLRALCNFGISYITQMLFNHNKSKEDTISLSPESSVSSESDREEGGSDVGDVQSSVTSLSDGEGKETEHEERQIDRKSKDRSAKEIGDEAGGERKADAEDGQVGGDMNAEDATEDRTGGDEGDDSSSVFELPEFVDHGGFNHYTVCNLLGIGELDELRMLRLKDGFLKLLERY